MWFSKSNSDVLRLAFYVGGLNSNEWKRSGGSGND